jgi:hypothetical protein
MICVHQTQNGKAERKFSKITKERKIPTKGGFDIFDHTHNS